MGSFRRKLLSSTYKIFDLLLMIASFGFASLAVSYTSSTVSFTDFLAMRIKVGNFVQFVFLLIVWHIVFLSFGLYRSRRLSARRSEAWDAFMACCLGTVCILGASWFFHIRLISPLFIIVFWITSNVLVVGSRLIVRLFLSWVRIHGSNLRSMLIVGTNSRAIAFARKIGGKPDLGYQLVGFADDTWPGMTEFLNTGFQNVCSLSHLGHFLRHSIVDEVVIGLPMRSSYLHTSKIAAICEEQGILIRLLPGIFDLKLTKSIADDFDGDSLITLQTGMIEGWPFIIKRMLDFCISAFLAAILVPVFLLIAFLIKLTSPGPIFFIQERVGLNKRRFRIYKFRTMVAGAEQKQSELNSLNEVSGPVFKIKNDPRLTPIGKFLRKTSIDELPQLFNVLKGEMSLVGPRPPLPQEVEQYDHWQRRRLSVRPGITCLWQVSGRTSIPFAKWMEMDMQYIDEWSLWLDLKILLKTIPAVLKGSGAA